MINHVYECVFVFDKIFAFTVYTWGPLSHPASVCIHMEGNPLYVRYSIQVLDVKGKTIFPLSPLLFDYISIQQ